MTWNSTWVVDFAHTISGGDTLPGTPIRIASAVAHFSNATFTTHNVLGYLFDRNALETALSSAAQALDAAAPNLDVSQLTQSLDGAISGFGSILGDAGRTGLCSTAAFGAHVAINLGVLELLDAASAGELIDIGGDPQQHMWPLAPATTCALA